MVVANLAMAVDKALGIVDCETTWLWNRDIAE